MDKYEELRFMHNHDMQMSGSGPTFFMRDKNVDFEYDKEKYIVYNDLYSVSKGVSEV